MLEDRKSGEGKKERKPSGSPFSFHHSCSGKKMQNNNSILHFCKRLGEKVRKDLWDKLQTCCLKLAAGLFCRDSAIIIAWFFRSRKSCCTPRKKMLRRSSAASGRQGFSFCTASVMVCSTASAAFCASRRTAAAASALPCRLRPCRGRASAKRIVPASFFLPSRFSARLACPRLRKKTLQLFAKLLSKLQK